MSHRRAVLRLALAFLSTLAAGCGAAGDEGAPPLTPTAASELAAPSAASVAIGVVASPRPAPTTDERRHLVYELVLVNLDPATGVRVAGIDVSDADHGAPLASFHGDGLAGRFADFSTGDSSDGSAAPGAAVIAFIDLAIPREGRLPRALAHRIGLERGGRAIAIAGPLVPVTSDGARPLGPPLHGGNLLDINGCCAGAHTRAFFVALPNVFVSQRFAIDFVRVDSQGTFAGDPTRNESYFLFGADVVAAGPGHIVEVRDGLPENVPTQLPPFDLDSATGNHIVEALDDGRFALYAHLATGSVRAAVGARVQRGQVMAQVGNTGHSDEPHLHFQVTDGAAPFASNGLPYAFDRFQLQATVDLEAAEPVATPVPAPQERRNRLPMTGDVVAFP
jgi:murein DD-endopeptidase